MPVCGVFSLFYIRKPLRLTITEVFLTEFPISIQVVLLRRFMQKQAPSAWGGETIGKVNCQGRKSQAQFFIRPSINALTLSPI
jgi:hypothetical protein